MESQKNTQQLLNLLSQKRRKNLAEMIQTGIILHCEDWLSF